MLTQDADRIEVDGVPRPVYNSLGQRIHASNEGIHHFWRWFGNSKVVDRVGRPVVCYHGTPNMRFTAFQKGDGAFGRGSYFADTLQGGSAWASGGRVIEAYLALRHPFRYRAVNSGYPADWPTESELGRGGYDSVIVTYPDCGREFVAWEPQQIKSATGNSGRFAPNSPRFVD